jgi:hypothetical protein
MKVIIDRFEGEFAVCEKEDRTMLEIPVKDIPAGAGEGDVLVLEAGSITVDSEETGKRKERIKGLMDSLWQ